jgi:hypothetical protein
MDDSKFNLWRATFSFCYVDGFLSPEESDYVADKLKNLPFSEDQKKTLMSDLKSPPDIDKLLPLITRPADRGFLINHIRLVARIDNLTDSEKTKIKSLEEKVLSRVNLTELNHIIAADEAASYHEDEVHQVTNKNLYSERVIKNLMKIYDRMK